MKFQHSLLSIAFASIGVAAMAGPTKGIVNVDGISVPASAKATVVSAANANQKLEIAVALKASNEAAFQAFADSVSDPASPNYQHFLTPEQVGQRFGATQAAVNNVVKFLQSNGIEVTLVAKNNMVVLASGTVAQVEKAFNTKIVNYAGLSSEGKPIQFYANSSPIQMPSQVASPVLVVGGLCNYMRPIARTTLTPANARGLYGTAPSYGGGVQGQGMSVGFANWVGYRTTNAIDYINHFGLPVPGGGAGSNINIVEITNGSNNNNSDGGGEGDLDMQMELAAAPLANIYVYDDVNYQPLNTYTRMANDNICTSLSESYGWQITNSSYATSVHNEHLTMSSQGQSYMAATGDNGTSEIQTYMWPDVDPNVTLVGGTVASVNNNNQRTSEVAWGFHNDGEASTGGWYTGSFGTTNINVLPSWQKGTGIPTNINARLSPDVALQAWDNGNSAFYIYYGGGLTAIAGTSCASPFFAGALVTMQQRLIANGQSGRLGNINPMIYGQAGRSDVWYDITSGNSNGTLPNGQTSNPTVGWDFITGWGAPNFDGWYNAIAMKVVAPAAFNVAPGKLIAGNLASLATIDNNYMQLQPGPTINSFTPPCRLVVNATSPVASASNLEFDVTAHGATHTVQTIELYNYSTGKYDLLSTVNITGSDQTIKVTASNANNYIQSGTKSIQARISYSQNGPTVGFPWNEYVNQTVWKVTP